MFHQTPSDTIDADAGKDMGMYLSLSTDVPPCARYLGCSTEVATLFWNHVKKIPRFLGRSLDTCQ
jgi:hypothetical protein